MENHLDSPNQNPRVVSARPLHPSVSTPQPLPAPQVLVWNLALVGKGEESHAVDPSCFYSWGRPEAEVPLRSAHDSPLATVTKSTQFHVGEPRGVEGNRASRFDTELPGLKDSQATVISLEGSVFV